MLQREKERTLQACLVNDDQKSLIGQEITSETVQELKSLRTESIRRTPYGSYTLLNFHVYANGLVIKEYKIGNQATRYEAVEAVEAEFVEEGIRYSDSIFEETPLAFIDYVNPRLLIQKGVKKLAFSRISEIKPAKYKGGLSRKKHSTTENRDDAKSVSNMDAFFDMEFGGFLKSSLTKTNVQYDGQTIYKVLKKNDSEYLKKGYGIYLDALHKNHMEVIDKTGKVKYVLNLDGTYNSDKTKKATGRVVKGWR